MSLVHLRYFQIIWHEKKMIFQITLHFLKNALSQVFLIVKPVDFKDFLTPHFNHSLSYPLDRKGLFVYLSRYEWFFYQKMLSHGVVYGRPKPDIRNNAVLRLNRCGMLHFILNAK